MTTEFNFNVRVTVGTTPALETLLSSLLQTPVHTEPVKEQSAPVVEEPKEQEAPVVEEPKVEEAPQTEERPKKYTAADVRAAIDKTRSRIIGEDYQNNKTSDKYQKYYRALTKTFKQIAVFLGSDKPSTLPEDKIGAFISQCDELNIADDGTIRPAVPF